MSAYARVIASAIEQPWALTKPMCEIVAEVLARRLAGQPFSSEEVATRVAMAREGKELHAASPTILGETTAPTAGLTAVVPVTGVLTPRGDAFDEASGMASAERLGNQLLELKNDDRVTRVVMDFDSPGGNVAGITETAAIVREVAAVKRVIAVANHSMASAAYWIAAGATEVVVSPSALVGSIGVFAIHEDISKQLEMLGVKVTLISAGKFKTEGAETEPLSEMAEEQIKAQVDKMFDRFVGDVASGRGVTTLEVKESFGQGRTVFAKEAVDAGMADRVATMRDVLAEPAPERTGEAAANMRAHVAAADDIDLRTRRARLARAQS